MEIIAKEPDTARIDKILSAQRLKSVHVRSEPIGNRKKRLRKLHDWIFTHREKIQQAAVVKIIMPIEPRKFAQIGRASCRERV